MGIGRLCSSEVYNIHWSWCFYFLSELDRYLLNSHLVHIKWRIFCLHEKSSLNHRNRVRTAVSSQAWEIPTHKTAWKVRRDLAFCLSYLWKPCKFHFECKYLGSDGMPAHCPNINVNYFLSVPQLCFWWSGQERSKIINGIIYVSGHC